MHDKMMLTPDVEYIIETLFDAGYRADVVGGAVRDHLLGRPSFDYDITTSATPDEVKEVFFMKILILLLRTHFIFLFLAEVRGLVFLVKSFRKL